MDILSAVPDLTEVARHSQGRCSRSDHTNSSKNSQSDSACHALRDKCCGVQAPSLLDAPARVATQTFHQQTSVPLYHRLVISLRSAAHVAQGSGLEFSGYSALSRRVWRARAASERRPLFGALGWGPRLTLKEKPTK
jgi:hypothetical protein